MRISSLLKLCNESYQLKGKATFWFGAIFAAISQDCYSPIVKDLQSAQYCEVVKILNEALISAIQFYPQEPTDAFYQFLSFCTELLLPSPEYSQGKIRTQNESDKADETDFNVVMTKAALKNNLIIHSIKSMHYSVTLQLCNEMNKDFKLRKVNGFTEVYLVFFSNYIAMLKKLDSKLKIQQILQNLSNHLQHIFGQCLKKLFRDKTNRIQIAELEIINMVYRKNQDILAKYQDKVIELLLITYSTIHKNKRFKQNTLVQNFYRQCIQKNIFTDVYLPYYEFCHHFQMQKTFDKYKKQKTLPRTSDQTILEDQKKLSKIQKMLQKSIDMLHQKQQFQQINTMNVGVVSNRFRRLNHVAPQTDRRISANGDINAQNKTIDVSRFQAQTSSALSKYDTISMHSDVQRFTLRNQVTSQMVSPSKPKLVPIQPINVIQEKSFGKQKKVKEKEESNHINKVSLKVINFKIGSIFIEVNDDGVILSDYTKQNKRYIQWNTVALILPKLQYKFVCKQFLKHSTYLFYDMVRLLRNYIARSQMGTIGIFQNPNCLLQLNDFVKFYGQEGKYTKLTMMNIYDFSKLEGSIDCYFEEFDHFFKTVTQNQYLQYLSAHILNPKSAESYRKQVYYLKVIRKTNQSIKTELQNQLTTDIIEEVVNDKQFVHKAVFLLKNNIKIYAKILRIPQSISKTAQSFQLSVKKLSSKPEQCITRTVQIQFNNIFNYLPSYQIVSRNAYIQKYGRIIFEIFNNFQDITKQVNISGLNFQLMCHFYQTEMIQIGKYFTMVSVEVIGTKINVIGIVVRYNFLPANKDIITLLLNPYQGFLSNFIQMGKEQKKEAMKRLLVKGSPKQTYLYLQKSKKLNTVSSLSQYLSQGLGLL